MKSYFSHLWVSNQIQMSSYYLWNWTLSMWYTRRTGLGIKWTQVLLLVLTLIHCNRESLGFSALWCGNIWILGLPSCLTLSLILLLCFLIKWKNHKNIFLYFIFIFPSNYHFRVSLKEALFWIHYSSFLHGLDRQCQSWGMSRLGECLLNGSWGLNPNISILACLWDLKFHPQEFVSCR